MVMNGKNLRFWLFFLVLGCFSITHADGIPGLDKIKHIIVIYQENWSFDGLYGNFPGAEGFSSPDFHSQQVDKEGNPLTVLPQPILSIDKKTKVVTYDNRFPADMAVKSFDLMKYMKASDKTGDLVHRYYQ